MEITPIGRDAAGYPEHPVGAYERAEATAHRQQSGEGGDQGAVGPIHPRAWRAAAEHGGLVTQNQDLDLIGHI